MATSLSDISKTFSLPIYFLEKMKKEGLIGDVVEDREIPWFVLIGQMWGKPEYIKMQIKGLSEKEKTALIKAEKPKPVDAYILKRYLQASSGQKIMVDDLAIEIRQKFGFAINEHLKARVRKIREEAKKGKRSSCKK
ncbi:MAG: hypothetical protein J0665_10910 [Deltaproteobacteria bacterium]|nr:hypothetical protein [Deltaproteobacteria bacterium]